MKRITKISSMLFLLLMVAWSSIKAGNVNVPFSENQALTANQITEGKEIALWALNNDVNNRWFYRSDNSNNKRTTTFSSATTFIVENADNASGIVLKRKSDGKYMQKNNGIQWSDNKSDAVVLTVSHPGDAFSYNDGYLNPAPSWDPGYKTYLVRFTEAGTPNILNGNDNSGFATGTGSWSAFLVRDVSAMPFELSESPENGKFAENTHWYYLKLNNKYIYYNESYGYIPLSTSKSIALNYFWAFVKDNNNKLKIYNAATGTSKVLASQPNPNTAGTSYPNFTQETTEGVTTTWDYVALNDPTKFCLNLTGETQKYLNDYGNNNKMAFWTSTTEGSQFAKEEIDLTTAIEFVQGSIANIPEGAVGKLTDKGYADFTAALDKNTLNGLIDAIRIRDVSGDAISFAAEKFYRLQNVYRSTSEANTTDYMLGANANNLIASEMNNENASLLWKIETTSGENNTVKLYHANAQAKAAGLGSTGTKSVALTQEGADYTMVQWIRGKYGFKIESNYLVQLSDNAIGSWNEGGADSDHAWYIMPAENIDLTITSIGYATVNYPFAVQLPSDGTISAYIGTKIQGETTSLLLKKISDGLIPANTPVVLVGNAGKHTLSIVTDEVSTSYEVSNILSGTLLSKEIPTETAIYGLSNPSGGNGVGFYKLDESEGANRIVPANKAYLPQSELTEAVQGVRGFTFSFDGESGETTGIENLTVNLDEEEFYDLQGHRVMNPTKGIYVTKSGKKILFTK